MTDEAILTELSEHLEQHRLALQMTQKMLAEKIIAEVREVVARWRDYADESRVHPKQRDKIQAALRLAPFLNKTRKE